MVFGLFKRKDPVCGMKEEKGKGLVKDDAWFCNENCAEEYEHRKKKASKLSGSCCH